MEIVCVCGGGGGELIYSSSAQLISFGIDGEHDYMNISPPPPPQPMCRTDLTSTLKPESNENASHRKFAVTNCYIGSLSAYIRKLKVS